ncbi:MAG TPA: hypothetical protein VNR87_07000 [Flavisolibacter sp.]|nr:hypothetical protein [Flavisolibacter sp.]
MSIRTTLFFLFLTGVASGGNAQNASAPYIKNFSEGIIYTRASFPGHALYNTLKAIEFNGDLTKQLEAIDDLKKYQRSLAQENEQQIKDAFFVSGLMVLPQYSKMYFTPAASLVQIQALGYQQETMIAGTAGRMTLADRDRTNQVTINFPAGNLLDVWQKYQIDAAQYAIQKTNETSTVAGYKCKKIIYTFNGNYAGKPVGNYIINLQPLKVTVWYTDDLPPSVNLIHPLYFELDKAVLKFEVEYDKNSKNKMLVEVMGVIPHTVDEDDLKLKEQQPVIEYKKDGFESQGMIMQIMMNAIAYLTK